MHANPVKNHIFSNRCATSQGIFSSKFALILILWFAALLRWYDPGLAPYTYDDASQIAIAHGIAALDGYFPILSGGTTLGIERAALHAYVLAFFLRMGGAIEAAVWGIGALGVLAVALAYRLGHRIGGPFTGLLTALFLAANPWLVYHDRRLWAHISILLSVALLYLAWRVIENTTENAGKSGTADTTSKTKARAVTRAQIATPIVLTLQILAHTLGIVQAISLAGAILISPRAWLRPAFLLGSALALLLLTPYAWSLIQSQPPQTGNGWSEIPQLPPPTATGWSEALRLPSLSGEGWGGVRGNHWTLLNHLVTGTGYASIIHRQETEHFWWRAGMRFVAPILWLAIGLGITRLLAWLRLSARRPTHRRGARLLLAWMIGPLLLLGLQPIRIAFQYWTVLLPLPALLAALGLDWLRAAITTFLEARSFQEDPKPAAPHPIATTLPTFIALACVVIWIGGYSVVHSLRARGEADIPLRAWQSGMAVARAAAAEAGTQEIRVAVNGVDPGYDGEPAAVATLIGNPPYARFVAPFQPPALLLAYDQPSLYYWSIHAPEAEALIAQSGEQIWTGRPDQGEPPARIYRLPPYTELSLQADALDPPPTFDMGLQLLAVNFPPDAQPDTPARYTLIWRVLEPPWEARTRAFTAFNHILDQEGNLVGQIDGLALLSRDWWPGDVLVQSYELTLPAGDLTWRTGLYSQLDGGRAITQDWSDVVDIPFRIAP